MARIIIAANLNTHVDKECSSSCLRLFLAGNKRTATFGVKFGFHRGTWGAESLPPDRFTGTAATNDGRLGEVSDFFKINLKNNLSNFNIK